jgi:hypothetical protein
MLYTVVFQLIIHSNFFFKDSFEISVNISMTNEMILKTYKLKIYVILNRISQTHEIYCQYMTCQKTYEICQKILAKLLRHKLLSVKKRYFWW